MDRPRRAARIRRAVLLTATFALLSVNGSSGQDVHDHHRKIDLALQGGSGPRRFLLTLAPGRNLPDIPGATFGERSGPVITGTATADAMEALAKFDDVVSIASVPRVRTHNDIATASSIGFRGTIASALQVDSYTFAGTAGQTVRIRVHGEVDPPAGLDPFLTVTDAAPVTDDNSGPGNDSELTLTWATTGTKLIEISEGPAGTTGVYLLTITSSTPILPSALKGGDIVAGVSQPHVAGTRAREARAIEGVDGSGVVVGIIDTGIHFKHEDFRVPGPSPTSTRLLAIWDQTLTPAAGEHAPDVGGDGASSNDYGVEYTETQINDELKGVTTGFVRHKDTQPGQVAVYGHGTHVAGIAAGNGSSSNAGFIGAAPGARIIAVKHNGDASDVINGIGYVMRKATELGYEGVVINLSLGEHDGPHDGTSPFDRAIDSFAGPGRYIVVSAGNDGDVRLHGKRTATTTASFTYTPGSVDTDPQFPQVLDFWAAGADGFTVTVANAPDSLIVAGGQSGTFGPSGSKFIKIENRTDSPSNGATHIRISLNNPDLSPWTITFDRTVFGGGGVVDGWIVSDGQFDAADVPTHTDGSMAGTVAEPGTATRAITVGAYRGKYSWESLAFGHIIRADTIGPNISGNIADFSSRGPTRDGRQKPDLSAPGAYVAAALAPGGLIFTPSLIDADGVHAYLLGTSMSAPEVAGLLALFLQKNRLVTPEQAKAQLAATALTDGFAKAGNIWGAGKADAVGLLASVPLQVDLRADAGFCLDSAPGGGFVVTLALLVLAIPRLRLRGLR